VIALCDVDETPDHLGRAAEKSRRPSGSSNYRTLLTTPTRKRFDCQSFVSVRRITCTRDGFVAGDATQQKHVHCQKPLTHTVHEARQMRLAAKKGHLVTQMGNQIQSHETIGRRSSWSTTE